jgi:CBS domain-containing protein
MSSNSSTEVSSTRGKTAERRSLLRRMGGRGARSRLLVKDLMSRDLLVCQRTDSCPDVAERMREGNVGLLPVLDGGFVIGVVTDRDLALRHVGRERSGPDHATVEGCMTPKVVSVPSQASLEEALRQMRDHQIRRLLVMDENSLQGILTLDDIFAEGRHSEEIDRVIKEALAGSARAIEA